MTSDISTQPLSKKDKTIGSTFVQDHFQIPIPAPRHEMYIQTDTLKMSPPNTYLYDSNMRDRSTCTQPRISSLERDAFGHLKVENYEMSRDPRREIDASQHISDRLHKTAQLKGKPKFRTNNSQRNLNDYPSSTSPSVKLSD